MHGYVESRLKTFGARTDPPLGETALLLAALDRPDDDLAPYRQHLDHIGTALASLNADSATQRAEALADLLHHAEGYAGDSDTYDDMVNANLMSVIDRRKGLPVALAILYLEAARRAGWQAWGIDFPGHFVIRLDGENDRAIIDPFHGGVTVEPPVLRQMLKTYVGEDAELDPAYYEPMSDRAVLLRLLNNIRGRALDGGDEDRGIEIMGRMLVIAPEDHRLWLESAAIQARAGQMRGAREAIDTCLSLPMPNEERAQAEQLKQSLNKGLN